MICPSCEQENSCGCKSCAERPAEFKRNIIKGDTIQCGYCNFKSSHDVWLDYEYSQYDKNKLKKLKMNENKKNTMNNIFRACLLMQSTLHRLENIQGEVPFVRENKARLNNTIKWLESIVCELTENLSIAEANEYIQLIASIDNFAEQIELEF